MDIRGGTVRDSPIMTLQTTVASCHMLPCGMGPPSLRNGRKTTSTNIHFYYLPVLERSSSCIRTSSHSGSIIAAQADPAASRAGKQLFKRYVSDSNNTLGRSPVSKMPHFLLSHIAGLLQSNLSIAKRWISSFSLLCCSDYLLN